MKKVIIVLFMICAAFSLWASKEWSLGFDTLFVQDFAFNKTAIQLTLDGRLRFAENYEIRIPLTYSIKHSTSMFDCGIFAICYPYKGLFFGVSIFEMANFNKSPMVLNEIIAGWNFPFSGRFFIEPSIVIRDPTGAYSNEYQTLRGTYPCYKSFRLRLTAGIKFGLGGKNEKTN